jgi:hypothetical protein
MKKYNPLLKKEIQINLVFYLYYKKYEILYSFFFFQIISFIRVK